MNIVPYIEPEMNTNDQSTIELTSMILLFVGEDNRIEEDKGSRSSKQYLKCLYEAYDSDNKLHLFVQSYVYGPEDASKIDRMRKSAYFDGALPSSQLITTINFFTGRLDPEDTSFNFKAREDGKYGFRAYTSNSLDENGIKISKGTTYIVDDKIKLGIEMINAIVGAGTMHDAGILEANIWMYNEIDDQYNTYKNLYAHEKVSSYTIKDISKSTKKSKNCYVGAVAMDVITEGEDSKVYTTIMPYIRTEKLRRKDLTMDMGLMETAYRGAYIIGSYGAVPTSDEDKGIYRCIGYSADKNRYVILDFTDELHDKLCEDVQNIDE